MAKLPLLVAGVRARLVAYKRLVAVRLVRRSLLVQLLGGYLLLVLVVVGSGVEANAVDQAQIRSGFRKTDQTLAQEISFDTYTKTNNIEISLVELSQTIAADATNVGDLSAVLSAYKIAQPDIDRVYWLDASGMLTASVPDDLPTRQTNYANSPVFTTARTSNDPVLEDGSIDPTTQNAVVTIAEPVRDNRGQFVGVLATTLLLDGLSSPLHTVIAAQSTAGQHLRISILDGRGQLVASAEPGQLLQPLAPHLPGAVSALEGMTTSVEATDAHGQQWLYTAEPVPALNWAVVVQRPGADVSRATASFRNWLYLAVVLFILGGLLFWLVLLWRVVRPLHALALQHGQLPALDAFVETAPAGGLVQMLEREDEVGGLARALQRLRHDVGVQLGELHTLLETSNAVVNSLDPRAVGATIIHEVQRLVDVQAAAVLVPDDEGALGVLVSEGRAQNYDGLVHLRPDQLMIPSVRALHDRRPVQILDDGRGYFPKISSDEGFRTILAIPILSQRVGNVALVVHRRALQPFTENELDVLLMFANYATLAWEHAVLYERSDERLREVARENERLYQQAFSEKQTMAAIMGSMSDGLLLTNAEGIVLYANYGARALLGAPDMLLRSLPIAAVHDTLAALAERPDEYRRCLQRAEAGERSDWLFDMRQGHAVRALQIRLFDVRGENGESIGRGLLLRDITREREIDQFKSTLLAAVGHELRTPLAAIKGYASTLLQPDVQWSLPDQHHFLSTISTEADRLAQLVTNLLDLSRLEAGLLELHRTNETLAELLASAVQRVHPAPAGIQVALPDDLPSVPVDRARILVVLQNLIHNAQTYGEGAVRVRAQQYGASIEVAVSNDGPPIDEEDLRHIFDRFYRASRNRSWTGGTGLGLAICKAFVEAHGGTIAAQSSAEGTTLTFTLPLLPVPAQLVPVGPQMPGGAAVAAPTPPEPATGSVPRPEIAEPVRPVEQDASLAAPLAAPGSQRGN